MVQKSKVEYLEKIRPRYLKANRAGKTRILEEFCEVCGYHRKHAIRLLNRKAGSPKGKPGRPSAYGEEELKVLEYIWLWANRPCGKRLKPVVVNWLPWYEKEKGLVDAKTKNHLLAISTRTLDRLMKPVRHSASCQPASARRRSPRRKSRKSWPRLPAFLRPMFPTTTAANCARH